MSQNRVQKLLKSKSQCLNKYVFIKNVEWEDMQKMAFSYILYNFFPFLQGPYNH